MICPPLWSTWLPMISVRPGAVKTQPCRDDISSRNSLQGLYNEHCSPLSHHRFFQHFCCWNFDRSHFRILLFFMLIRAFSGIVLPAARFSYIRPPPEPSPLISGDLSRHVFCTFIITALSLLSIKILCKNRIILWSARYWLSFSLSVKIYPDRSRYPNGD